MTGPVTGPVIEPVTGFVAALYALPPAEFVGERNRVARRLKADGRPDDAQVVASLRRPKLAEHALNLLAREQPELIDRLIEAISVATAAQVAAIEGQSSGLRAATAELRAATSSVVDAAVALLNRANGASGEGQRDEILLLLRTITASRSVEALRAGILSAGVMTDIDDIFPGAPDVSGAPAHKRAARRADPKPVARVMPPPQIGPSPAERARRIQLERHVRDALTQVERAVRGVAEAETQVAEAQGRLGERSAVLEARRRAADEAAAALDAFRRQ